jgi:Asp-tRNA(Asn)/Glu-tRNA(Gln) amidotransferase C subunit
MGQTSRIVTIIEGVQVIEVTTRNPEGDPIETSYRVRGEKYETLRHAMKAARGDREGG